MLHWIAGFCFFVFFSFFGGGGGGSVLLIGWVGLVGCSWWFARVYKV